MPQSLGVNLTKTSPLHFILCLAPFCHVYSPKCIICLLTSDWKVNDTPDWWSLCCCSWIDFQFLRDVRLTESHGSSLRSLLGRPSNPHIPVAFILSNFHIRSTSSEELLNPVYFVIHASEWGSPQSWFWSRAHREFFHKSRLNLHMWWDRSRSCLKDW